MLPANNIWNTRIDHLPVASNSATLVNTIGTGKNLHPDFGAGLYAGKLMGLPVNLVPGSPMVPVNFVYPAEADPGPYPIPLNAVIEGGTDRHVLAVDTTNCKLYEMFYSYPQTTSWQAHSGAVFDLRSNALRPYGWTSADAAGLPMVPGLIRYEEVAAGEIKHAIRFTAPQTRRAFVWPARHYASNLTGTQYPRMGERLRLKASYNISNFPADIQVILTAMKRYGIILSDNGSAWYVTGKPDDRWNNDNLNRLKEVPGSAFEVVDATTLMVDPNSGEAKQPGVNVTVSPANPSIYVGQNKQFTATVTGNSNTSVKWSVDGVEGGSAARGFISDTGLYMAPTTLPSPANVVVKATSVAVPTASGSTTATVTALPNITSASPNPITTSSFTLTLTGVGFHQGAVMKFNGSNLTTAWLSSTQVRATGTVGASASSIPVSLTNPDGTASNTTYVSATIAASTLSLTPAAVTLGAKQSKQFFINGVTTQNGSYTWKINGVKGGTVETGLISAYGWYNSPVTVPAGGKVVTLSVVSNSDPTKTATATITLTASTSSPTPTATVSLTPATVTLGARQSKQFFINGVTTQNGNYTWKINGVKSGTVETGLISAYGWYNSPVTVPAGGKVVTLSVVSKTDPTKTDTATITLVP